MKRLKHHEYTGRIDDESRPERFHQVVKHWSEGSGTGRPVFIGFCSEEGVHRNKGRLGAKEGPYKIREKMASLPYTDAVFDYGSIIGEQDLEASQEALGECVAEVFANGQFPMIMGG